MGDRPGVECLRNDPPAISLASMQDRQPSKRSIALSDEVRSRLSQAIHTKTLEARRVGFARRDNQEITQQCVTANIPKQPAGELSVCGAKDFLIDEIREFTNSDGKVTQVRCASSAVLEMTDSPIHIHEATLEYYIVLAGSGKMVLGQGPEERVVPIETGSVILIPPGQAHGVASDDPETPIKALLTFTPGMAPLNQAAFRDEAILHNRATTRLRELGA